MKADTVLIWQALPWIGTEHCEVLRLREGLVAKTHMVGYIDGAPFAIAYKVEMTHEWEVRRIGAWSLADITKRVILTSDMRGHWNNEQGTRLPQFDGCTTADVSLSPFTNTLPVKTLQSTNAKQERFDVLYIDVPSFTVRKTEQVYNRLDELTYRFHDKHLGAQPVDIRYDAAGFVVEYPGYFRRVYPQNA